MKGKKILLVCVLMFTILAFMSACGSDTTVSSDQQANTVQTEGQKDATPIAPEPATAEEVVPTPDPSTNADSLLGKWVDVNTPDHFAEITKTDTGFEYKDNDGTYPGIFKDGKLKLQVSDSETAEAYYETKTGHMFLVYQDSPTEFKKD